MSEQIHSSKFQDKIERNVFLLLIMLMITVSIGGLVEIVPLFYLHANDREAKKHPEIIWHRKAGESLQDWKPGDGIRPYTALELAGRDVYEREGCYLCHSQMIRPFRDENDRYGHYSLAAESMYDHPFQWGSERQGPDLARVGGKYSDDWLRRHFMAPRSVVPESIMPNFPWLAKIKVNGLTIQKHMRAMQMLGVPYTKQDIADAPAEVKGKTDMDALIAYIQVLGTEVKFQPGVEYRE